MKSLAMTKSVQEHKPFHAVTKRKPAWRLTAIIIIIAGALLWLGWHLYGVDAEMDRVHGRDYRMQELVGEILRMDEVLTMSARMAAATLDPAWEARYRRFEPQLDEAIKESSRLDPQTMSGFVAQTDAANRKLVDMENKAFALVRQGDGSAASMMLSSPDYEQQKQLYADGIRHVSDCLRDRVESGIESYQTQMVLAVCGSMGMIVVLSLFGLAVLRVRERRAEADRQARQTAEQARNNLEMRVAEATADLAAANHRLEGENEALRQAKEAMRLSEEWFRVLFENSRDAMMTVEPSGPNFVSVNLAALAMFRAKNMEEMTSRGPLDLSPDRQPDGLPSAQKADEMIGVAMREGSHLFEWSFNRLDGDEFPATIFLSRIENAGNVTLLGTIRDTTSQKRAEQERRHLADILEATPDFVSFTDAKDAHIRYINKAGRLMTGLTPDEDVTKLKISDFHQEWANRMLVETAFPAAGRDGSWTGESALLHRDGHEIPVLMSLLVHKNSSGEVEVFSVISHDITKRTRAEKELRDSREFLNKIINCIRDPIFVMDDQDRFVLTNDAWNVLHGRLRGEAMGLTTADTFPPEIAASLMHRNQQVLATGVDDMTEEQVLGDQGQALTVITKKSLYVDASGKRHVVGIVRDITDRKRMEEDLRETNDHLVQLNARLNTTAEELKALMRKVVEDPSFEGRFVNPLLLHCWEAKKCDKVTCPAHGRTDDLRCWETAGTFCKSKVQGQFALKFKDCCGCEVYQAARADPVSDLGETFNNMMAIIRERNMDIKAINRKLEQANAAKSRFLANMSHEIRTPMTAILGFAEMIDKSIECCTTCSQHQACPTRTQNKENIGIIRRNGEHLLGLINDILDISKIEAGKMEIERVPCSPVQIVEEAASLMRIKAIEKGLSLDVRYEFPLPEIILSDPARVRQVLINLLGNAVKFTSEGSVEIVAHCITDVQKGQAVMAFDVNDTGIGMMPDQIGRLFQPFAQADSSTTRQYGGTGLGLAISKRLAHALGGDILVASRPGEGSTFTLTMEAQLPAPIHILNNLSDAARAPHQSRSAPIAPATLRGRILVAEDGPDNQKLISLILTKAGADVDLASNGRIAVERALSALSAGTPYDAILMDMQMPEMDGYEATSTLRKSKYDKPIVALTAHAMTGDREKCIAAGCDEYANKPVDRIALLATLARLMGCPQKPAPEDSPAAAAPAPKPPADAIRSDFLGDPDMAGIIAEFVGQLPQRLSEMRQAAANNQWDVLQRMAHQLKGAGGSYGYPCLTDAARELESHTKRHDTEAAMLALNDLTNLYDRIQAGHIFQFVPQDTRKK